MRTVNGLPLLVTVDGPPASGKSTAARALAKILRVPFLSTGALYRAVAWLAIHRGVKLTDERAVERIARTIPVTFGSSPAGPVRIFVSGCEVTGDLALPEVARVASSHVAEILGVRAAIVERSRRFFRKPGLVSEGRDCGSVIFPGAPYKFFLTASVEARARRRMIDHRRRGDRISLARLTSDLVRREREERARKVGALAPQPDAWIVDNTGLDPKATLARILRRIGR
jgi:cytidylate kinase